MTITIKRHTDSGAPALNNTAGSMITLLDYLLVTTMGWTKPYTGTNLAAYRQPSGTNQFYLRVDDTGTTSCRVSGYEAMSSISSGTGNFPTSAQLSGGLYWGKSQSSSAAPWKFFSNGKIFYMFIKQNGANYVLSSFGDFTSYKASDAYGTIIIGETSATFSSANGASFCSSITSAVAGHYVARSYTQVGSSAAVGKFSNYFLGAQSSIMGAAGMSYPSPVDGGLHLAPIWINETGSGVAARGLLPGLWNPLHNRPLTDGDTFSGTGTLSGRDFECVDVFSNAAQAFIETSDTWGGF